MADEPYVNPFQKVHQQVQAAKDRARENNRLQADRTKTEAEEEAVHDSPDRAEL
jgi:hypothetical protein